MFKGRKLRSSLVNQKLWDLSKARSIILSVFCGCLVLISGHSYAKKNSPPLIPPTVVSITKVQQQLWQEVIPAVGSLSALQGIIVHPEINGRVTKIFFRAGQKVVKNTPLVQLNPTIIKADLALAKAQLHLSELDYQRQKTLASKHLASQAMLDKALATRNTNQAIVARNQALLEQTFIRAPFSGTLGLNQIEVGDFVIAGNTPIVSLQDSDTLKINFSIAEKYIRHIHIGQKITVKSDIHPETTLIATITAYNNRIDPQTRSLAVRAEVPNTKHQLFAGGFVNIGIQSTAQPVLTIPQTALSYSPEGEFVFTIHNNMAHKVKVVTGAHIHDNIIVRSGLRQSDIIVKTGQFKLHDHAPVITKEMLS